MEAVDTILRYGLFLGAIFQLICIGAVIIMPDSCNSSTSYETTFQDSEPEPSEDEFSTSDGSSPQISPSRHYRLRRGGERKKRR